MLKVACPRGKWNSPQSYGRPEGRARG